VEVKIRYKRRKDGGVKYRHVKDKVTQAVHQKLEQAESSSSKNGTDTSPYHLHIFPCRASGHPTCGLDDLGLENGAQDREVIWIFSIEVGQWLLRG
jgi:hypothetical protein